MRILLDTHILIWVLMEPARLDSTTRTLIARSPTEVLFSVVSAWEIAIKSG